MIWILVTAIVVVIAKYFTSIKVKHLEVRLNEAKGGIDEARIRLKAAKDTHDAAKDQEKATQLRLERLRALIQDMEAEIQMPRRAPKEEEEEEKALA